MEKLSFWFERWPLGELLIAESPLGLRRISWTVDGDRDSARAKLHKKFPQAHWTQKAAPPHLARQFREFFSGDRNCFELPLDPRPGSLFQERVLRRLQQTNAGQTITYGELAAAVGSPGAARAVGRVMAANPLPIVIPCHRVLPADRSLGNYTGGSEIKRFLLELEGADPGRDIPLASNSIRA